MIYRPQKTTLRIEVRLPKTDATSAMLEEAGLDVMDYDTRWKRYRIRLTAADLKQHQEILAELFNQAYQQSIG